MRVVFDTNVVISACFWRGAPYECLTGWAAGRFTADVSIPLLAEYEETFEELLVDYGDRPHINWVALLRTGAGLVFPSERATGATRDPFDEMVLECAVASKADAIISGDKKHLLPLGHYLGIPILDAARFLKKLG